MKGAGLDTETENPAPAPRRALPLVPRLRGQGYDPELVARRRAWLEEQAGCELPHIGSFSLPSAAWRGNVENPIGAAQVPLGIAGPLEVHGRHARGTFFVPLATTEGALVRSYERGMVATTRAGGVTTRIYTDGNRVSPIFRCASVAAAFELASWVEEHLPEIRARAEATTRHGKLLAIECLPVGPDLILDFRYHTADAQGMNMIVKATDEACRWIEAETGMPFYVFSGYSSEKRTSGALLRGGKGKKVVAGATLPAAQVKAAFRASPEEIADVWKRTVLGHLQAGTVGYNGHYANGLAALFIATGQDVANVAESAVGITRLEVGEEGALEASVTLTALSVATVGGGTGLGTGREGLEILGCAGTGGAPKLAEIAAATLLAGEISMAGAIASGEFAAAHEAYGRNRPEPAESETPEAPTP